MIDGYQWILTVGYTISTGHSGISSYWMISSHYFEWDLMNFWHLWGLTSLLRSPKSTDPCRNHGLVGGWETILGPSIRGMGLCMYIYIYICIHTYVKMCLQMCNMYNTHVFALQPPRIQRWTWANRNADEDTSSTLHCRGKTCRFKKIGQTIQNMIHFVPNMFLGKS